MIFYEQHVLNTYKVIYKCGKCYKIKLNRYNTCISTLVNIFIYWLLLIIQKTVPYSQSLIDGREFRIFCLSRLTFDCYLQQNYLNPLFTKKI